MTTDISINKPEPFVPEKRLELFNRATDIPLTIKALEAGKTVLITAFYSNGLVLLKALQSHLKKQFPNKTFLEQRQYRDAFRKLSNRIVIEIADHKLIVKKAPSIGWLAKLYPETANFLLTFPQVQGLNSSWQWHERGIQIPMLRNKIHPYYGTYMPTRFEHLELFDNWLKRYSGPKKTAIDVGIGSGVLSLQLIKHGFQKVYGTDSNPNAIVGLKEFMGETKLSRKIEVEHGFLFGKLEKPTELIIFNPPWLPESRQVDALDEAIYYPKDLFPNFFKGAEERLLDDGRLLIIFSNLAQITKVTKAHPIEKELAEGGRFKLEHCFKKSVRQASKETNRDQHWRSEEAVELWVLSKK